MYLKYSLFWDCTQGRMVVPCICFGSTYRPLEVGDIRLSRNIGKRLQFYAT